MYITSIHVQTAVGQYRAIESACANGYGTADQHIAARKYLASLLGDLTEDERQMYSEYIASLPPEVIHEQQGIQRSRGRTDRVRSDHGAGNRAGRE